MKLIDLLVQELPKRGGWTVGSFATQDGVLSADGCCVSFWDEVPEVYGDGEQSFWADSGATRPSKGYGVRMLGDFEVAEDFLSSVISREQYESALAASKQPEWDEDGKPGIGVTCEHCPGGATQTEWEVVTVLGVSKRPGGMFTDYWLRKEDGASYIIGNPYRFRPIRTEAERKREDIIKQMSHSLRANGSITNEQLDRLYDDIANGNIFGIKLAD